MSNSNDSESFHFSSGLSHVSSSQSWRRYYIWVRAGLYLSTTSYHGFGWLVQLHSNILGEMFGGVTFFFFFFPRFFFFFNLFQSSFPMTFNCQWKKFTQVIPVCSQDQKPLRSWSRMFHFPFFDFLSQSPLKITLHDHVKKVAFYSSLNDKVQIAKTPGSSSELNIILSLNQQFYQMNTGIQTKTYTWVWYCDL